MDCHAQPAEQVEQLTVTPGGYAGGEITRNEQVHQLAPSSIPLFLVSTTMKFSIALLGVSVVVMVLMIFQAVLQELNLHGLKTRMQESLAEVERKEDAIIVMKNKVTELKTSLDSANGKRDELKKKKAELEKSTQDFDTNLKTCTDEKARDRESLLCIHCRTPLALFTGMYHFPGCTFCLILPVGINLSLRIHPNI